MYYIKVDGISVWEGSDKSAASFEFMETRNEAVHRAIGELVELFHNGKSLRHYRAPLGLY